MIVQVRTPLGFWCHVSAAGSRVLLEYDQLVVRQGMAHVVVSHDGRVVDRVDLAEGSAEPQRQLLGRGQSHEPVWLARWLGAHLELGLLTLSEAARDLEMGDSMPIDGARYETADGLLVGALCGGGESTHALVLDSGECVDLPDDEAAGLWPAGATIRPPPPG